MIRLVIFDCDGVLVDSEGFSAAVIAEEAASRGIDLGQSGGARFTGLRWADVRSYFERAGGAPLPEDFARALQARTVARMEGRLRAMPHARETLLGVSALGLPWCVASNSSQEEMAAKFAWTGLADLTEGRVFSARDVAHGKPAPDVFLAAAAALGQAPAECLVVEDSEPGVAAGRAAGMRVLRYRAASPGVTRIDDLLEVLDVLRAAPRRAA